MSGGPTFQNKTVVGAAVVSAASLIIYYLTLAPTVTLVDSGELIVAARFLGVAHPPGFPLYLMLAHLASLVPLGNVAERINFGSAVFAALAAGMLVLVAAEIIGGLTLPGSSSKGRSNKDSPKTGWAGAVFPAVCSALLFAFSRTMWSYATIAEVYTLNTFLVLTIIFLMLRWRRRIRETEGPAATAKKPRNKTAVTKYDTLLYAAAVVFGLAMGVHHVTIALLLPALAVLVYRTQGLRFFTSRRLLFAALFALGALVAVNCYLPWAASRSPILNWGNPRSLQAIWWHITGRQYQVFVSFDPGIVGEELGKFVSAMLNEFGTWWLPLALILAISGYAAAFKRDRTAFWFLFAIAIGNLAYALSYDIAEDKDAYYLLTILCLAIAGGLGLSDLVQRGSAVVRRFALLGILIVPLIGLIANWPFNNKHRYFVAQDYVENIQSTIEPNSLLLTLDWQTASPMMYTREVEHRRTDIKAIDAQLLRRSWYFDFLRTAYPDLVERSRDKIDGYLTQLKHWEQDPDLYKRSNALSQSIHVAFQEMLHSIVTKELGVAPVYVTAELILLRQGRDIDFTNWLGQNFQAVPRGLVFQILPDRDYHDPGDSSLQLRGLIDGSLRFAPDDVVKVKVLTTYKAMFESRGQYLAHFNQRERASAAFVQARQFAR